jgi:DNA-binding NarL/FixJ family response regulator
VNIAIVEKNDIYRESLITALNQIDDFKVVSACRNSVELYPALDSININVLLLDYSNGCDKCLETIRIINQSNPNVKVVVLTDSLHNFYDEQLKNSGVDAIINKDSSKALLEAQIRNVFPAKN